MEKIINFIKQNLKLLLAILLVIGLSVLIARFLNKTKEKESQDSPFKRIPSEQSTGIPLEVIETSPTGEIVETWRRLFPIIVLFSEPINESTVKVEISPNVDVTIQKDQRNGAYLWIIPSNNWRTNTRYTITITEAKSISGNILETPYIYEFIVERIPAPNVM